jgi:hypothetical protein
MSMKSLANLSIRAYPGRITPLGYWAGFLPEVAAVSQTRALTPFR